MTNFEIFGCENCLWERGKISYLWHAGSPIWLWSSSTRIWLGWHMSGIEPRCGRLRRCRDWSSCPSPGWTPRRSWREASRRCRKSPPPQAFWPSERLFNFLRYFVLPPIFCRVLSFHRYNWPTKMEDKKEGQFFTWFRVCFAFLRLLISRTTLWMVKILQILKKQPFRNIYSMVLKQ